MTLKYMSLQFLTTCPTDLLHKLGVIFMDPLKKGIAIGMLFGSSKETELNDKEVEIDVGDILDALTGIFTYNPEDEDPSGDPPGPWDGYSLFTVDLTAVKQSLEDIIAALQQHDPEYDPDETPPEVEINIVVDIAYSEGRADTAQITLGTKTITENGTYPARSETPPLDGFSSVTVNVPTYEEEYAHMLECLDAVAEKLGMTPPYDCTDVIPAIDQYAEELVNMQGASVVVDGYTANVQYVGMGDSSYYVAIPSNPHIIHPPELAGIFSPNSPPPDSWFPDWVAGTQGSAVTPIAKLVYNGGEYYFTLSSQYNPWNYSTLSQFGLKNIVFHPATQSEHAYYEVIFYDNKATSSTKSSRLYVFH